MTQGDGVYFLIRGLGFYVLPPIIPPLTTAYSGRNTSKLRPALPSAAAAEEEEEERGGLRVRVEVGGSGLHPVTEIVHLGFGLYRAV